VSTTGAAVNLTTSNGTITDAGGNPLAAVGDGGTFYVTLNAPGSAVIDAEGTATLFFGRVFFGVNPPQQKLIAVDTNPTHTSVSVSVDAADTTTSSSTTTTTTTTTTTAPTTSTTAATTSTTDPTTTARATTTTEVGSQGSATTTTEVGSQGRELPRTGSPGGRTALIALGLALVGSAMVLTARRGRPSTHR
jgi:LPXTG-motif cell wall-anchored protein